MKTLVINLPPEKLKAPGEAVLTFSSVHADRRAQDLDGSATAVFKLRLDHNSAYIHFYDRENGFTWEGPNQSALSVTVVDPVDDRPHVTVTDTLSMAEVHIRISAKVNRYEITFPAIYNWIEIGNWAIPIP